MSDILRMRLARAPQRLVNKDVLDWTHEPADDVPTIANNRARPKAPKKAPKTLLDTLLARPAVANATATSFLASTRFAGRGAALAVPVREMDTWLAERGNRADPAEVVGVFEHLTGRNLASTVSSAVWRRERQRIFDSLVAAFLARAGAAVGGELMRLLLVCGLLESLATQPSPIVTADDVERALRYRTILIPPEILSLIPRRSRLARRYGFADLFVVRDEWNRYEAGEIAHIENVLPFELKKRALSTLAETEVTTVDETETTTAEEHDSQTTDRMELKQHAQTETDLGVHVAAQVEVEASYGPMHITATAGGSFDYSQKNAEEHAYQQSHEMVTRAVTRVEQRVRTSRTTRSLQRTTEDNKHAIDNQTAQRVVGIYRWVDKVQRLQLFRYPHRLLLEFEIPEPAAYLSWRRAQPRGDFFTPEPVALIRRRSDFTPLLDANNRVQALQPGDINETSFQWWVAQYNVMGVTPPPPDRVLLSTRLELKEAVPAGAAGGGGGGGGNQDSLTPSITDKSLFDLLSPGGGTASEPVTVPQGYRVTSWSASGYAADDRVVFDTQGYAVVRPSIDVTVGSVTAPLTRSSWVQTDNAALIRSNQLGQGNNTTPFPALSGYRFSGSSSLLNYPAAQPITGIVQIMAHAVMVKECALQVTLTCGRMDAAFFRWQQQTYEQISAAYWALKRQRADEQAAQSTGEGVVIKGDSPARNKEVVIEELKRGVIEMLTGDNFRGRDALQTVPPGTAPKVNLDAAIATSEEIQFIEQAFEWENLTYVLYPYFWGKYERWPELADVTGADPEFSRFLRSGSARIVVPARPKFENQVCAYVDFGLLWGGGPIPTVNDPDYLSIAAEIMAQQTPPDDGEKRRSWEVRLPTTLVWLDSDSALPKVNASPKLDAPPGPVPVPVPPNP
jgi:hypothetical protein